MGTHDLISMLFLNKAPPLQSSEKEFTLIYNKYVNHFLHVARNKSITVSCEQLNISQPALTKSIKRLERALQHDVFTRTPRGVELTPEGEIFYKYAEHIENQFNTVVKDMKAANKNAPKQVVIGADNLWAEAYLTDVLIKFYKLYPNSYVRVVGGPVKAHLASLIDGKTDIVLGSSDFSAAQTSAIYKRRLCNVKYFVIGNKNHPLNLNPAPNIANLVDYSWVIYQHASNFVWNINELFENNGLPKAVVTLHTAFLPQAIKHVQSSNSLMFVPERLLKYMTDHGLKMIDNLETIHNMDTGYIVLEQSKNREEIKDLLSLIEGSI